MSLAGRKFRSILVGIVATFLVAGGFAASALAQTGDRDCADFPNQEAAQRFFEENGGSQEDPHRLDADNDGEACETFAYDDDGDGNGDGNTASNQYGQYQQQQQQIINIPNKPLPVTAGLALIVPAGGVLLGAGLVMWRMFRQ